MDVLLGLAVAKIISQRERSQIECVIKPSTIDQVMILLKYNISTTVWYLRVGVKVKLT